MLQPVLPFPGYKLGHNANSMDRSARSSLLEKNVASGDVSFDFFPKKKWRKVGGRSPVSGVL